MQQRFRHIGIALTVVAIGVSYPAGFSDAGAQSSPHRQVGSAGDPFFTALAKAALERPKANVRYDGRYFQIPYPMGDVPANVGVCTDEVIRVYRAVGVDLQQLVHEDMQRSFSEYPHLWGLSRPNSSIDHRRVPNLMYFFEKHGAALLVSNDPSQYTAGDVVVWQLSNGLLHIGLVVEERNSDGQRPLIVHNIGAGPKLEDALFVGKIIGHFRYAPKRSNSGS
jgi:hypothetical protein